MSLPGASAQRAKNKEGQGQPCYRFGLRLSLRKSLVIPESVAAPEQASERGLYGERSR
jgi:hypothetical protein